MAEVEYRGSSRGGLMRASADDARLLRKSMVERPATANMALSLPDRKDEMAAKLEAGNWKTSSLKEGLLALQRPKTAPLRVTGSPRVQVDAEAPASPAIRAYGRVSLFDREENGEAHANLGPTILRDLAKPRHGFPLRGPDHFLKRGEGPILRIRVKLKELLSQHPVNREPPFRPGNGGVRMSWESPPSANSVFRYLYDNGTIDFVSLRWGTSSNEVVWGRPDRPGVMYWGDKATEVETAKWLPIFLEGIREYQEPYRFLSIMGSHDLISEAGTGLHTFCAELVPPFKKALDTREPTVVITAVELMKAVLLTDPEVGKTWIYYLPQFCQPLNLFLSRGFLVNLGYNSHKIRSIKAAIQELLVLLQQQGGPDATALVRRYMRIDPIVTDDSIQRRRKQEEEKPSHKPWKQYTLI